MDNREFVHTRKFDSQWGEMGCDDDDLMMLQREICKNPLAAPVIPGTGGIRKLRFALDGRGKSGGARILYVDYFAHETIALLLAYPKNEKENITQEEKAALRSIAEKIEQVWRTEK